MNARFCMVAATLAVAVTACAQTQPRPAAPAAAPEAAHEEGIRIVFSDGQNMRAMMLPEKKGPDFFPPELVMLHQNDIGLTADQQAKLRQAAVKLATDATDLRWQQIAEQGALEALLKQPKPDEAAVLAQQAKVLKIEGDLKMSHLTAMLRIKNTLTPEQQTKLTAMARQPERGPMEHRAGPGNMENRGRAGNMGNRGWGGNMGNRGWGGNMGNRGWGGNMERRRWLGDMMRRGGMDFRRHFGHGPAFGWGGRMGERGEMGHRPGDGDGLRPGFGPGMRGPFGGFMMRNGPMGPGGQPPKNPPPPPAAPWGIPPAK